MLAVRHPGAVAAGGLGALRGAAALLRAWMLLFVPVCYLQASIASALGTPLPPALHLAVQAASVAGPLWRAPSGGQGRARARVCVGCVYAVQHLS